MTQKTATLAILFADIAQSTHLYDTLGNAAAKARIDECLAHLATVTADHRGTLVKTIGDEIMCTFPSAQQAVAAAVDMQRAADTLHTAGAALNLYVGIQHGPAILEGGDVFGDAVNVAARMVALAKQRQIVTTADTIAALPADHAFDSRCIDTTTIKGKSGKMAIYEIVWEEHDVTTMVEEALDPTLVDARLELRAGGRHVFVDQASPTATLGRQAHNDIVVNDPSVSRSHARVEYRRGKFTLVDQSSNGTRVELASGKTVVLKREEAQLLGSGTLCLGTATDRNPSNAVYFNVQAVP